MSRPVGRAAVLLAGICAIAKADELHKKDGTVVHGRVESESASSVKFVEVGKRRAATFDKKELRKVVLTFALPDFVYTDPKWSKEMVDARVKTSFDPEWGKVEALRSEHFIVFTNASAGDKYLDAMEDVYARFKKIFPFEEPKGASLLPIFLFRTPDQYFQYYARTAEISVAAAKATAGHAWKDYYATYYASPKDVVNYHEGAHQLVANRLGLRGGGSWFQEGLAVYFEGTVFPNSDPAKGTRSEVKTGRYTPFAELFALASLIHSSDTSKEGSLIARRYRESGAIIKFLLEGPDQAKRDALLEAVRNDQPWEQTFRTVYQRSIPEMEQAFVNYYKG